MSRMEGINSVNKPKGSDVIDSLMASHIFPKNKSKQNIENSSDDEDISGKPGSASRYKQLTEDVIREHFMDLQKVSTPSQIKVLEKQLPWNLSKQAPPPSSTKPVPIATKNSGLNFQNYTPYTKGVSMFLETKREAQLKPTTNTHYQQRREPNFIETPKPPPSINTNSKSSNTFSSNTSSQTAQNLYNAKQKLSSDSLQNHSPEPRKTVTINTKAEQHLLEDNSSDDDAPLQSSTNNPPKNHINFFYSSALRKEIQSPPQRERLRQYSAPSAIYRDQLSLLKSRAKSTLFSEESDDDAEDESNMSSSFDVSELPKKPGTAAVLRTPSKDLNYSPSRYASNNAQPAKPSGLRTNTIPPTASNYESSKITPTNNNALKMSLDTPTYKSAHYNNNTSTNQEYSKPAPNKIYADVKSRVDTGSSPRNAGGKSESTSIFEALLAKATQEGVAFADNEAIPVQDEVELEECEFCERKFRVDIINKHMNICKKNQNKVVRQFDMKVQRAVKDEDGNILSNLNPVDSKPDKAKSNVPTWKKQSEQLRSATKVDGPAFDDRIQCAVCGRKFNADVHERHIQVCKSKARDMKTTKTSTNNNTNSVMSTKFSTRK